MQLLAVIVPPVELVPSLLESAHDLCSSTASPGTGDAGRGLLERLLGRHRTPLPPAAPISFRPAPADAVFVRLAKFGNVTGSDADGLAQALGAAAGAWPAPVLHTTRLTVAEAEPHDVTAHLEGDVDALRDIYRNVNEVARQQRFFLDRRSFRSELRLGSVDVGDAAPVPASVAGAEAPHHGPRWAPSHVTLVRAVLAAGATSYAEVAQVALARGAEALDTGTGA